MQNPPPKTYFRRNLPHFHPDDAIYFVTFRLAHTISGIELQRIQPLYPGARATNEDHAKYFQEYDFVLDAARHGPKYLAQPEVLAIVKSSLDFAAEQWLDMIAYAVMPNQVHFVAKLKGDRTLPQVMQSIKGFSAREANKLLQRTGTEFWQREYYDRVVREGRLGNTVYYILMNPVKAGLVEDWRDWGGSYLSPGFYGIETLGLKAR
jgi:REP element-mobilizing transposase RayT